MDQIKGAGGLPVLFLMKCLLFSYILTGALLALLALILYKAGLDEKVVAVAMIVISTSSFIPSSIPEPNMILQDGSTTSLTRFAAS